MALAGKVNIYINNNPYMTGDSNGTVWWYKKMQKMFGNLHNFFSSSCAPLGVKRRACFFGDAFLGGKGLDYPDGPFGPGSNAWALFEFTNASPKFWVLIQACGRGADFGGSNGSPGLLNAENNSLPYGVGIAIACRRDGGSPWNGTTANTGSDTKGNPVWISGSSTLYCWPRSNNAGGAHETSKQNTIACMLGRDTYVEGAVYDDGDVDSLSGFVHMFASNEFITLVSSPTSTRYQWFHFGKYIPIPELSASCPVPFFAVHARGREANSGPYSDSFDDYGTPAIVGSTSGGTFDDTPQAVGMARSSQNGIMMGGVATPITTSSPVQMMLLQNNALDRIRCYMGPNGISSGTAYFEEFPLHVYVYEAAGSVTGSVGYLGITKDLRFAYGELSSVSINSEKTKAAIEVDGWRYSNGSSYNSGESFGIVQGAPRLIIPWTGSVKMYANADRRGTDFYIE